MIGTVPGQPPGSAGRGSRPRPPLKALALLLVPMVPLAAQAEPEPGADLRVLLLVIEPGDALLSRFGHSALWIQDLLTGTSTAYNFGASDSSRPGFWSELLRGRVPSESSGRAVADVFLTRYVREDRSVWVQELNLLPAQRAQLKDLLDAGAPPEGDDGIYQFYRDNCTTAIRDALDWVLQGQIWEATAGRMTEQTLRDHTRPHTRGDPFLYWWVELITGQPVDRPITVWEEMFLPETLRDRLREIQVRDADGELAPLVAAEELWFQARRPPREPERGARATPAFALGLLAGLGLLVTGAASRRHRAAKAAFFTLGALWLLGSGLLGTGLALLWGFTDQYVTYRNENLLQLHPGPLLLLLLLILTRLGSGWAGRALAPGACLLAGLAVLGALLKLHPGFLQANEALIALAVPVHLGFTAGIVLRASGGEPGGHS